MSTANNSSSTSPTSASSLPPSSVNDQSGRRSLVHKAAPSGYQLVSEGTAAILFGSGNEVFYNEVQETNRDLSVLAIQAFRDLWRSEPKKTGRLKRVNSQAPLRILEALSATGLRSIRYWKEIEGVGEIVANDFSMDAVEAIQRNVEFNDIKTKYVKPNHADATAYMYGHKNDFHVVDLDPYGTASPFLETGVQAVEEGGLLCVTCTDMAVLAGNSVEACFAKYGSTTVRSKYCHEMAIRILLSAIQSHASRYKRYIVPQLSLSIDFYVRVFVRVYTSPSEVKKSMTKVSHLYQCSGCDAFYHSPVGKMIIKSDTGGTKWVTGSLHNTDPSNTCSECGSKFKIAGPIWNQPLHDSTFISKLREQLESHPEHYGAHRRVKALLTIAEQELSDCPLFYDIPSLCNTFRAQMPKIHVICSAIKNAGYRISRSHCNAEGIKTDAPPHVMMDIIRCWIRDHSPVNRDKLKAGSPAAALLKKEPQLNADFTPVKEADLSSRAMGVAVYPPNPSANWGPKSRAKGGMKRKSEIENQEAPDVKKQKKSQE